MNHGNERIPCEEWDEACHSAGVIVLVAVACVILTAVIAVIIAANNAPW